MSDSLREAIARLQDFSDRELERNPKMRGVVATVIAALANPQNDAELAAWLCFDKIEERQHITTNAEDAADRKSRPSVWSVTSLYAAPPSEMERMREALAQRCFIKAEPCVCGYHVSIGFETLAEAQALQSILSRVGDNHASDIPRFTGDTEIGVNTWRQSIN